VILKCPWAFAGVKGIINRNGVGSRAPGPLRALLRVADDTPAAAVS